MPRTRGLQLLDRSLAAATAAASVLVLPLTLLLCAQWPLRDGLHAYSAQANDLAQLLFGVYVSVAMVYASRMHAHLTPDLLAHRYAPRLRQRLLQWATACIVVPWTLFILAAATPMAWQSLRQLEHFTDTANPGYFILRLAVLLLALLLLAQAVLDLFPREPAT
jgi:TRAP-type C4-dicarboxylate transport system permease small subunit